MGESFCCVTIFFMDSDFQYTSRANRLFFVFAGIGLLLIVAVAGYLATHPRPISPSNEITVTVPEGYTVRQIGKLLADSHLFSEEAFVGSALSEEGYLFPDTYRFYKDATPEEVIQKMKENFERKLTPEIRAEILHQKHTLADGIIMASIVEEEAQTLEDKKIIAGILWKRIKERIGLQVDATLTYLLGKTSAELTESDLRLDSPYNTYKYRGLPKGPISNPGLDTILATVYPTPSSYYYYLSDKDGVMHYAKTFEEHKQNKFKYLRR